MKVYTFQIEVHEGNDEWWESGPTPEEVRVQVECELEHLDVHVRKVKIVQIVDTTEYE